MILANILVFSIFGAKQFQDSLGGNFGDYIADYQLRGKFLTHFEELTYPFYANSIIPNATFNRSENNDSIFLETLLFDDQNNQVESNRTSIPNKSDGVYTVQPSLTSNNSDWVSGVTRVISIPNNILLDGDKGTYENAVPASWNISSLPYSVGTPNQIGDVIVSQLITVDGQNYQTGGFNTSAPNNLKANEPLSIALFDTEIQVVQGQEYILNSNVFARALEFQENQRGNSKVFLGLDGYDLSELLSYTTFTCPTNAMTTDFTQGTLQTSFVAKGDTIKIKIMQLIDTDINVGTGGVWYLDETTVKGPIEFLTESKLIKSPDACNRYNTQLRWKNDLGGWEQWNFNRYRTFNERVSNRNEIRRDVTLDWDNYFINGDTEFDTINQDVRLSVVLRSGLLTEDEQVNLNQIRRSIKIQVLTPNNKWTTVTVEPNSYLLTDESEYMREVSFEILFPNTLTQEQ